MCLLRMTKTKRNKCKKLIISIISSFFKNSFGKGPELIKVEILDNFIYVYCEGYLTYLEKSIIKSTGDEELVNCIRNKIVKENKKLYISKLSNVIGKDVDISSVQYDYGRENAKFTFSIR